ncbi:hypothetical protein ASPNIDRAFT_135545, partial [Aspergillus niger ATCC 1015]
MTAVSSEYAHQTKGPRILAVFWTMTSLAILAVAARLFIRIKVLRNPGADDWLIATSMVITTVDVALGYGKHAVVIADRLELVLLVNYINFALGIISFALPKLAVAALLSPKALWDTSLLSKGASCRSSWILVDYAIFTGADATADLVIWTSIESNVVILASCIPTLQPLLEIILGKRSLRNIGSQDSILQIGDDHEDESHYMGHIRRTDKITVVY